MKQKPMGTAMKIGAHTKIDAVRSAYHEAVKANFYGLVKAISAGATTPDEAKAIARKIAEALSPASVAFTDMDAYYKNFSSLTLDERRKMNWDHPDALDMDLIVAHLGQLARGEAIDKPLYDFVGHLRKAQTVRVAASDVVVIDGILLFVDQRVRDLCDIKLFVDVDADIRLIRRIRRDMARRGRPLEEILEQYLTTVQPMHLQFVEPSKRYADIIVPRGAHNKVAIDLIVATIQRRLQGGAR